MVSVLRLGEPASWNLIVSVSHLKGSLKVPHQVNVMADEREISSNGLVIENEKHG